MKDGNKYEKIACKVTPMKWIGKGLLGCKLDPLWVYDTFNLFMLKKSEKYSVNLNYDDIKLKK